MPDLSASYKSTVKISFAFIADILIFIIVVESIRTLAAPFEGWFRLPAIDQIRLAVYAWSLAQMFLIRLFANLPLKSEEPLEPSEKCSRLRLSTLIAFALCELVVVLGFVLFVFEGLRADFYLLTALSLFYFIIYFPKKKDWEEWFEKNRVF